MKRTGIESLLPFEELARHYKEMVGHYKKKLSKNAEQKSSAGLAKARKYERLKRFARKIYFEEVSKNCRADKTGSSHDTAIKSSHKELKISFKAYYRAFDVATNAQDWNEFELGWLVKQKHSAPTDTTLYDWWKALNKELRSKISLEN